MSRRHWDEEAEDFDVDPAEVEDEDEIVSASPKTVALFADPERLTLPSFAVPTCFLDIARYRRHEVDEVRSLASRELTQFQQTCESYMRRENLAYAHRRTKKGIPRRKREASETVGNYWAFANGGKRGYSVVHAKAAGVVGAKIGRPAKPELTAEGIERMRAMLSAEIVAESWTMLAAGIVPKRERAIVQRVAARRTDVPAWLMARLTASSAFVLEAPELPELNFPGVTVQVPAVKAVTRRTVERWRETSQKQSLRESTSPEEGRRMIDAVPTDAEMRTDVEKLEHICGELFGMALRLGARFPSSEAVSSAVDRLIAQIPNE